jgi:hypothetical protein
MATVSERKRRASTERAEAEARPEEQEDPHGSIKHLLAGFGRETQAASEARRDQMLARRETIKSRRRRTEALIALLYTTGLLVLVIITPLAFVFSARMVAIFGVAYGVGFMIWGLLLRQRQRGLNEEISELGNELDLVEIGNDEREQRATKLLQVNQFDLRRYYEQTLRQGSQIFYVGVVCILLGFAIIGVAFWLIQDGRTNGLSEKIVVAALGAIGGVLANFIAVIYLRMFSKTIKSVGQFHHRLVVRDRLNFSNILAAKIATDRVREQTLSEMARQLARVSDDEGEAQAASANGTNNGAVV